MGDFTEVADRVWVARQEWFDVNVTLVGGERGLLVVDTHGSGAAAAGVAADVRRLGAGPVLGLVNTHWHFDHTFGNAAMREAFGPVPITAHERAAEELAAGAGRVRRRYAAATDDPRRDEVLTTDVTLPDDLFSSTRVLDLGDRAVELVHPGRGHTGGDLVALVPDARVLLAGDLVEEPGPPSLGDDSWPLEWPLTLDLVVSLLVPAAVVVPGHGAPVDRDHVVRQRDELAAVAETIRDLAARGVPPDEALAAADWPWEPDRLGAAVRRGYEQLPRGRQRLPLV